MIKNVGKSLQRKKRVRVSSFVDDSKAWKHFEEEKML